MRNVTTGVIKAGKGNQIVRTYYKNLIEHQRRPRVRCKKNVEDDMQQVRIIV